MKHDKTRSWLRWILTYAVWAGMIGATAPARAQVPFASVNHTTGVATDNNGNVWASVDRTFDAGLAVFDPNGASLGYVQLGGFSSIGAKHCARIPVNGNILVLDQLGQLYVVNATTGAVAPSLNLTLINVDVSHIYDVATGFYSAFQGNILPAYSTFGDIAIRQQNGVTDLFVTGLSQAQVFPFVMQVHINSDNTYWARVLVSSSASTAGLSNPPRGIAVNAQGTVATTLPINAGILGTVDRVVTFSMSFPETGQGLPAYRYPGSYVASQGMTADSSGNFYIATGELGASLPGLGSYSGCVLELSPDGDTLLNLFLFGGVLVNSMDVALSPAEDRLYVAVFSDSAVYYFPVLNPPRLTGFSLLPTTVAGGETSTGTLTLSKAAPAGGMGIALLSGDTDVATVPLVAIVPAGETFTTFPVTTKTISSQKDVTIFAGAGGVILSAKLTVKPTPGSITGQVFNDKNGNGSKDAGDTGLSGWTVYLDTDNDGNLDSGETSTTTDSNGQFTFNGLAPGSYHLEVVPQNGWLQTLPDNGYHWIMTVNSGQQSSEDVGFTQTDLLMGQVFNDKNGNGSKEADEPGLAGWTVYLDTDNDGLLEAGEVSTTTDANGKFRFTGLSPGAYHLEAVPQFGWLQTLPQAGYHWVVTFGGSGQWYSASIGFKEFVNPRSGSRSRRTGLPTPRPKQR